MSDLANDILRNAFRRRGGKAGSFSPIFTLAAFGILIALGLWQLQRRDWKNDLIERFEEALAKPPSLTSRRSRTRIRGTRVHASHRHGRVRGCEDGQDAGSRAGGGAREDGGRVRLSFLHAAQDRHWGDFRGSRLRAAKPGGRDSVPRPGKRPSPASCASLRPRRGSCPRPTSRKGSSFPPTFRSWRKRRGSAALEQSLANTSRPNPRRRRASGPTLAIRTNYSRRSRIAIWNMP